ncbi:MAG: iron ABC transporter permease, partial [Armatimonadetes bacterium]|nr:iron ABC transporter permease [Armatimonadota bacterium]
LLAGVAMSALLSAAMSLIIWVSDDAEVVSHVYFWMLGGFNRADWVRVKVALPYALLGAALCWLYARDLNALLLGEESALHLGVDVERAKLVVLTGASLASAAAVSVSGIIGFVGLIAPHLVRLVQGPDHRALIPSSALLGALFLVACDTLARTAFPLRETPVGVLTAFTGVPFFLYLLRRSRRAGG